MNAGTPRPYRPPEEDRPIRRTWWTLSLALLALAFITGVRAGTSGDALDWIPFLAVGLAAAAAFLHRRAVARLEARERLETENFARILQGLSRSVSVDAIVGAIVDDLAEGTGADHVVVVRRRPEGRALEATLMTRRDGVPNSTTVLPLTDLESPVDLGPPPAIPVPVSASDRQADQTLVAVGIGGRAEIEDGLSIAGNRGPGLAVGPGALHSPVSSAASRVPSSELARGSHAHRVGSPSRSVSAVLVARRVAHGTSAWLATVLDDLGVAHGLHPDGPAVIPVSEVVGSGASAVTAERIAERVRRVYGLSHTLAAPLQTETGVVGAIVLSRRDRVAWPVAARRLLEGSANEASAAMARAYSYREAETNASTDPLTGLPNRRYFDEFCGLLARRRRSGDGVAVLMVDIDKFKVLNDAYGHPVGDEVLKAVASAIVAAVREEDVPARVGGEEFAVLLRNPGPDVAAEVGERVRQGVRALDLREHGVPGVSVSVGVANARTADEAILAIIERADKALLSAKRSGRDRVVAA